MIVSKAMQGKKVKLKTIENKIAINQSGYSLIEVLVAVVIIAVGILGIAGLQVISIQQNRSAMIRAEATKYAADILDRIRVNRGQTYEIGIATDPATPQDCRTMACSPSQMRDFDLNYWKCDINHKDAAGVDVMTACGLTGLGFKLTDHFIPGGQGGVVLTADNVYEVTIRWKEDDAASSWTSITLRSQVNI